MRTVTDDIAQRCAAYLGYRMPEATDMAVTSATRIFGGASCETYRVRASWKTGGKAIERGLIFRRDSAGGLLEIERKVEFHAYHALHAVGLPVPQALYMEEDPKWFERPFFVMEEIEGCSAASSISPALEYGENAAKVGEQFFSILGRLVRLDPESVPELYACLEKRRPQDVWRLELDYWEKEIDQDTLTPQPAIKAGIRWLRNNPPPPPQKLCFVHGDYRSGNFLFNPQGEIKAVLDWEMVHLGDPLEDLSWGADPMWQGIDGSVGKMVMLDQAIALWEQASGLTVDPEAFRWWRLFSHIKGAAIWISAGAEYAARRNLDPLLVVPAWWCTDMHDRMIVQFLRERNQQGRAGA